MFLFLSKEKCSSPPREGGHKIGIKVKSLLQLEVHVLSHLVPHVGGAVGVFVNQAFIVGVGDQVFFKHDAAHAHGEEHGEAV